MILLLIMGFGLVVLVELPGLLKRKNRREILLFAAILDLGFTLVMKAWHKARNLRADVFGLGQAVAVNIPRNGRI